MEIKDLSQDVPAWKLLDRIAEIAPLYHQRLKVSRNDLYLRGAFVGYEWVL